MKCVQCKNTSKRKSCHLIINGKAQPTSFCSYKCYLQFWEKNPNFDLLPEAKI